MFAQNWALETWCSLINDLITAEVLADIKHNREAEAEISGNSLHLLFHMLWVSLCFPSPSPSCFLRFPSGALFHSAYLLFPRIVSHNRTSQEARGMKMPRKCVKRFAGTGCGEKSVLFCLIKKQQRLCLYQDSVNRVSVILSMSQLSGINSTAQWEQEMITNFVAESVVSDFISARVWTIKGEECVVFTVRGDNSDWLRG